MIVVSYFGVWKLMFKDYNYQAEMRMIQATMVEDWQGVLKEATIAEKPSRIMVMLKNIALMHTGELGEVSFQINGNSGEEISNEDSLNISTMQIAAPLIYFNYGHMNYAMRWCMENVVDYGFSPFFLKIMAQCAKATGEKELEKRYTHKLNQTLFYSDWKAKPINKNVKDMMSACYEELTSDQFNCELYLIEHLSVLTGSGKPLVQEVCLFYAIMMRDGMRMWPAFADYLSGHKGEKMPLHFQEAYVLCRAMKNVELPYNVDISPVIIENYKQFMQEGQNYANYASDEESVGEMLREKWGGTYWWYNAFGRTKY